MARFEEILEVDLAGKIAGEVELNGGKSSLEDGFFCRRRPSFCEIRCRI